MDTQEIALVRDTHYKDTVVHKIVVIDIPYQETEGKATIWGYVRYNLAHQRWDVRKYEECGNAIFVYVVSGLGQVEKFVRAQLG